jgi:hypothetical protein
MVNTLPVLDDVANTEILETIDREIAGFEKSLRKLLIEAARFPGNDARNQAIKQWQAEIAKRKEERKKYV